jgi:hypothetical protein
VAEEKRRELEGRIERLEQMFGAGPRREAVDLSADDINAYIKVRDVIAADYGEFCGINDCFRCIVICRSCIVCRACRICRFCDVECFCGPCNIGGMSGGLGDFTRFGG